MFIPVLVLNGTINSASAGIVLVRNTKYTGIFVVVTDYVVTYGASSGICFR